MNDYLHIWISKETEIVKYRRKEGRERFQETATCQTYHEESVTGDKCLHSPPDILCLSLAFPSPPLPLFHS